ncbi:hypothetical protein TNCV_2207051 [Trichonephila clavipes]|uniref:Uncharacterized protein n=1 Tax=Trichonephila clavipes TaxID=2585209 RepID=A0A8X6VF96_TRICX|nr:hypothetical protein TNCV_2207051 [Trichonephila clavipes]
MNLPVRRPSGVVISDANCCAVEPEFESRRRHGSTLNNRRASSPTASSDSHRTEWRKPNTSLDLKSLYPTVEHAGVRHGVGLYGFIRGSF